VTTVQPVLDWYNKTAWQLLGWPRSVVVLHSGITSVFDRWTFPVLRSICSLRVTTYVGKPSAICQPTRPINSAFHPFGVDKWVHYTVKNSSITAKHLYLILTFRSHHEIFIRRSWYSVFPSLDATISCRIKKAVVGILLERTDSGGLKLCIYRKPTHTDQYLNFSSHHPVEHKLSVARTLLERSQQLVTVSQDKIQEDAHVEEALRACGYPHGLSVKLDVRWSLKVTRGRKRIHRVTVT